MAYAALNILLETLGQLSSSNQYFVLEKNDKLESLLKNLNFFQAFLEESKNISSSEAITKNIQRRIKGVACRAQDLIEDFVSSNGCCQSGQAINVFDPNCSIQPALQQILEEVDSIKTFACRAQDLIEDFVSSNGSCQSGQAINVFDPNWSIQSALQQNLEEVDSIKTGGSTVKQSNKRKKSDEIYSIREVETFVEFNEGMKIILDRLLSLSKQEIFFILGKGSLADTIAGSLYSHPLIKKHFVSRERVEVMPEVCFQILWHVIQTKELFGESLELFQKNFILLHQISNDLFLTDGRTVYRLLKCKDGSKRILTSEISSWNDEAARLLYKAEEIPHELESIVEKWFIVMSSILNYENVDPPASNPEKEEEKEADSTTINQEVPESTSGLSKGVDSTTISLEKVLDNAIVGLETDLHQIKDQLTGEPRRLEIVAVVGMGGIGKTTLARAVFDDPLIQHHFYVLAWVKVSQVYQLRDLLLGILRSVAHLDDEMDRMSNEQLKEKLYRSLKGQRYLIVMDDMWSNQAWDDLRMSFPDDKNGSRVLLTSRLKGMAVHVSSNPPHQMSFLNNEHSWELLHHQIILKQSCPSELEDIGMKIAEKCKGLPLAIIVVAGVLSSLSKTRECWENVADSMTSVLTSDPEQYHGILAMSYDYLPHHLKACFLYLCAFPEDCEIECRRLIRLWVAEGFVKPDGRRSLEEVAEDYLQDLIDRSLLSAVKRSTCGKLKSCCVHDLLWDLSLREARKENFMHVIMTRQVQVPSEDNSIPRRLSFHSEGSADFHSVASIELTRSFLCFEVGFNIIQQIHATLSNFKLLRVLDIGFVRFDYFPLVVLKLIHLRFLALTAACELPSSISQLWNLQTLIVHGPWIRRKSPMLPPGIWLLSHLRHLYLTAACYLPDPSKAAEIGNNPLVLLDLQTLSTLRPPSCTVEVFKNLPNLKKLGILETKEDFDSCERSSHFLENLFHLHELETLKCFLYPQKSEKMRLPHWNAFPPGIKKLTLSWSYLPWEDMDTLTMLPKLEVLKLKNYAFQGAVWEPNEEGFQSLKLLLIEKTDLVHWKASKYDFPCLQYLILRSCESLEEIPCDIADDLQLIELQYCSPSVESSAREIQEEQRNRDNDGLLVLIQSKRPMSSTEIDYF